MSRNVSVLVFVLALVVGLGLAYLVVGVGGGVPEDGDGLDRAGQDAATGDPLTAGGETVDADAVDRGPVLFGRPHAERAGAGGVSGRVADVEDDAAIGGARLLLVGTGFGKETVQIRGTTAEDGTFRLTEVPAGDGYALQIEADGQPGRLWPDVSVRDRIVTRLGTIWLGAKLVFEGRVLDPQGLGIVGADVRLHAGHFSLMELFGNFQELLSDLDREPEPIARALTGAQGVFRVPAQDPGPITVVVRAPGFAPGTLSTVVAPQGEGMRPIVIRLSKGTRIAGKVVDPSGRGFSGARIAVMTSDDPYAFLYGRTVVESSADGSFSLDTAGIDEAQLLVTYPGYPITFERVEPGTEDARIVLERGATLVVRLVDDGTDEPVEGAQIMLSTSERGSMTEQGQSLSTGTTDRTGTAEFDVRPGKLQMVMVSHPGRSNGVWVGGANGAMVPGMMKGPEDSTVGRGRREVEFRLAACIEVTGRVTDDKGVGIAGVRVASFGGIQMGGKPALTDADGLYALKIGRAPFTILSASAPGYVSAQENLSLMEVGPVVEQDITLARAAVVSGRVLDESGRPIPGAQVRAVSDGSSGFGFEQMLVGDTASATGANGGYVLDGVAPGERVRILAHRPGYVDEATDYFEITAGGALRGKDVVLTAGLVLELTVEDGNGRPLEGAKVEMRFNREDNVTWDVFGSMMGGTTRTTDRNGLVREENAPPSSLTVTASHPDWASVSLDASLARGAASPATHTLRLRRPMTISGRVVGAGGAPVAGAFVSASPADGEGASRSAMTDGEGRFELTRLPEGAVTLGVNASGYEATSLELSGPSTDVVVRLQPVDPGDTARREALTARLIEISQGIQSASSDEERQAMVREMTALQQEIQELVNDGEPGLIDPDVIEAPVIEAEEIEMEEIVEEER